MYLSRLSNTDELRGFKGYTSSAFSRHPDDLADPVENHRGSSDKEEEEEDHRMTSERHQNVTSKMSHQDVTSEMSHQDVTPEQNELELDKSKCPVAAAEGCINVEEDVSETSRNVLRKSMGRRKQVKPIKVPVPAGELNSDLNLLSSCKELEEQGMEEKEERALSAEFSYSSDGDMACSPAQVASPAGDKYEDGNELGQRAWDGSRKNAYPHIVPAWNHCTINPSRILSASGLKDSLGQRAGHAVGKCDDLGKLSPSDAARDNHNSFTNCTTGRSTPEIVERKPVDYGRQDESNFRRSRGGMRYNDTCESIGQINRDDNLHTRGSVQSECDQTNEDTGQISPSNSIKVETSLKIVQGKSFIEVCSSNGDNIKPKEGCKDGRSDYTSSESIRNFCTTLNLSQRCHQDKFNSQTPDEDAEGNRCFQKSRGDTPEKFHPPGEKDDRRESYRDSNQNFKNSLQDIKSQFLLNSASFQESLYNKSQRLEVIPLNEKADEKLSFNPAQDNKCTTPNCLDKVTSSVLKTFHSGGTGGVPNSKPDQPEDFSWNLSGGGGGGGGKQASRIFHPDAYCNICDREFCNKYFLKTHKANKHGIFDDNGIQNGAGRKPDDCEPNADRFRNKKEATAPPSDNSQINDRHGDNLTSLHRNYESIRRTPSDSYLKGDRSSLFPPSGEQLLMGAAAYRSGFWNPVQHLFGNALHSSLLMGGAQPSSSSSSSSRLDVQLVPSAVRMSESISRSQQIPTGSSHAHPQGNQQGHPQGHTQGHPHDNHHMHGQDLPQAQTLTSASSPEVPEDYCELCRRHFCNKYYLKKHRSDVHGIGVGDSHQGEVGMREGEPREVQGHSQASASSTGSPTSLKYGNILMTQPPRSSSEFGLFPDPFFSLPIYPSAPSSGRFGVTSSGRQYPFLLPGETPPRFRLPFPSATPAFPFPDSEELRRKLAFSLTSAVGSSDALGPQSELEACSTLFRLHKQAMEFQRFIFDQQQQHQQRQEQQQQQQNYQAKKLLAERNCDILCRKEDEDSAPLHPQKDALETDGKLRGDDAEVRERPRVEVMMDKWMGRRKENEREEDIDRAFVHRTERADEKLESDSREKEFMDKGCISNSPSVNSPPGQGGFTKDLERDQSGKISNPWLYRLSQSGSHASTDPTPDTTAIHSALQATCAQQRPSVISSFGGIGGTDRTNDEPENVLFERMLSAKLADRVTCDLCGKQLCNKYFLKTHKFKIHGWTEGDAAVPKPDRDPLDLSLGARKAGSLEGERFFSENQFRTNGDVTGVERGVVRSSDAARSAGIFTGDDVATVARQIKGLYDIPKSVFCSPTNGRFSPYAALFQRNTSLDSVVTSKYKLPESFPHAAGTFESAKRGYSVDKISNLSPSSSSSSMSSSSSPPSITSSSSWRSKDYANPMRVECQLCKKVLCNKYFLRTHMLKKHSVDVRSLQTVNDVPRFQDIRLVAPDRGNGSPLSNNPESSERYDILRKSNYDNETGKMNQDNNIQRDKSDVASQPGEESEESNVIVDDDDEVDNNVYNVQKDDHVNPCSENEEGKMPAKPTSDAFLSSANSSDNKRHSTDVDTETTTTSQWSYKDGAPLSCSTNRHCEIVPSRVPCSTTSPSRATECESRDQASPPQQGVKRSSSSSFECNAVKVQKTSEEIHCFGSCLDDSRESSKRTPFDHLCTNDTSENVQAHSCRPTDQSGAHLTSHPKHQSESSISQRLSDRESHQGENMQPVISTSPRKNSTTSSSDSSDTGTIRVSSPDALPTLSSGAQRNEDDEVDAGSPVALAESDGDVCMQPFILKESDALRENFVPSLVFLPTIKKVATTMSVTFNLTPFPIRDL